MDTIVKNFVALADVQTAAQFTIATGDAAQALFNQEDNGATIEGDHMLGHTFRYFYIPTDGSEPMFVQRLPSTPVVPVVMSTNYTDRFNLSVLFTSTLAWPTQSYADQM